MNTAVNVLTTRGGLVVVAIHPQPRPVNLHRFFWCELELSGAPVPAQRLISRIVPVKEVDVAFDVLEDGEGVMKILLGWRGAPSAGRWPDRDLGDGVEVVMPANRADETSRVAAAQAGDPRALDDLVSAYLPFVYTLVRRALGGLPDVDDVVQETMLRALRELRTLRTPESFRPWLATIATRQVSTYLHRRQADAERTASPKEVNDPPDADAEALALVYVELSGLRQQAVRASHWLDPDDRQLLSLWWLETAGHLTRTELAAALGTSVAHAGVRVQRMRHQLDLSRSLVAALGASPRCAQLAAVLEDWDGAPSPRWRKRIARHIRSCPVCTRAADGLVPSNG